MYYLLAGGRGTGDRAGSDVVQLYIRDVKASVSRPVKELKGFQKVTLEAGETRRVHFQLTSDDLSFTGLNLQPTLEPGEFHLWVGPNAAEGLEASFVLERQS